MQIDSVDEVVEEGLEVVLVLKEDESVAQGREDDAF